jgi:hypothetical protein
LTQNTPPCYHSVWGKKGDGEKRGTEVCCIQRLQELRTYPVPVLLSSSPFGVGLRNAEIIGKEGKGTVQIIDEKEAIDWLYRNKVLESTEPLSFSGFMDPIAYDIKGDSGIRGALGKSITTFFEDDTEALLWIDEWGIWGVCENMNLFLGYRKSLGESSKLIDKPGHLFSKDDLDAAWSLVSMVLYFSWGAVLFSPARQILIRISHDELLFLFAKKKETLSKIRKRIEGHLGEPV